MRDLYLRFPDEATSLPLLYSGEGDELTPRFRALDVIGVLYTDADPPEPMDGWHVNVRAYPDEDVSGLLPFEVVPTHPRRVWA